MCKNLIRSLLALVLFVSLVQGAAYGQRMSRHPKSLPVDAQHMDVLIKTSIIAVNHANRTGDYSVLRALAAPGFRKKNSEKDLEKFFTNLRTANLDLGHILHYSPRFTLSPGITPDGFLRLKGYFPTRPVRLNFDLMYQPVSSEWRLNAIGLHPSKAGSVAANRQ